MNLTPKINCIEFTRYEMYEQQLVGNTSTTRPNIDMTGISTCNTELYSSFSLIIQSWQCWQ